MNATYPRSDRCHSGFHGRSRHRRGVVGPAAARLVRRLRATPSRHAESRRDGCERRGVRQRLHGAAALRPVTRVAADGRDADEPRLLAQRARTPPRHRHARDAPRGTRVPHQLRGQVAPRLGPRPSAGRETPGEVRHETGPARTSRRVRRRLDRGRRARTTPRGRTAGTSSTATANASSSRATASTRSPTSRSAELDVPDDRPRLLFVSYLEPHHQNSLGRAVGPKGWAARFADHEVPADLAGRPGDWRWNYSEYLACCASIDANLGRLLAAIDAGRGAKNTLVAYASDHGNHFRTRNLDFKRSCHDASIRVPLVLRGPGFDAGTRSDALVTLLDIMPTLVTAAGGDHPAVRRDRAATPAAATSTGEPRCSCRSASPRSGVRCARRRTRTRCAHRGINRDWVAAVPDSDRYVEDKLYDNVTDPAQRHNLVRDPATADLRAELAARPPRRDRASGRKRTDDRLRERRCD